MEQPIISILIPVYKVENELPKCVDSIISQDYDNYEVILVDDGSPDNSPMICDNFAKKYPGKIRVIHKENGGLISARKRGVEEAKGRYLVFLDSDDTMPRNALSVLCSEIDKGYDIVKGTLLRVNMVNNHESVDEYETMEGEITAQLIYQEKLFLGDVAPYLCGGIYRASLFEPETFDKALSANISVMEDWTTNMIISKKVHKVKYIKDIVYYYYYNPNSIMNSSVASLQYIDRVDAVLKEYGLLDIPKIKELIPLRSNINYVNSVFKPELPFLFLKYKKLRLFIRDKDNYNELSKRVNYRYLIMVYCMPVYYLYTIIYSFLYRCMKMKGKNRRVLY